MSDLSLVSSEEKHWRGRSLLTFYFTDVNLFRAPFQTSSLPFTSGLLSCSLWLRYGMLINEKTVILVNAIGVFLFSLYCITYYLFTVNKRRMSHQLLLVLLMISFAIAYSKVEPNDLQASKLIGEKSYLTTFLSTRVIDSVF